MGWIYRGKVPLYVATGLGKNSNQKAHHAKMASLIRVAKLKCCLIILLSQNILDVPTMEKSVKDGNETFVSYIFDRGNESQRRRWLREFLPLAARFGHENIVKMLLNCRPVLELKLSDLDTKLEGKTALRWSQEKNFPEIARDLNEIRTRIEERTGVHKKNKNRSKSPFFS